jgi:C4-type Zn-finger protein
MPSSLQIGYKIVDVRAVKELWEWACPYCERSADTDYDHPMPHLCGAFLVLQLSCANCNDNYSVRLIR